MSRFYGKDVEKVPMRSTVVAEASKRALEINFVAIERVMKSVIVYNITLIKQTKEKNYKHNTHCLILYLRLCYDK